MEEKGQVKMNISIADNIIEQLEEIAAEQKQDVALLVQEVLEQYIAQQNQEKRKSDIRRIIAENRWVLDELAKQ